MNDEFKNNGSKNILLEKFNQKKIRPSPLSQIFYGMIGALIIFFLSFVFPVLNHSPKQVATVDITGMVNAYIKTLAQENMDQNTSQAYMKEFVTELQQDIQIAVKKENLVILPKEAVIAGAKDITPEILKKMTAVKHLDSQVLKNNKS